MQTNQITSPYHILNQIKRIAGIWRFSNQLKGQNRLISHSNDILPLTK